MRVRIEFEVEIPDVKHTEKELEDFLRFEYGDNGVLEGENPFNIANTSVEPIFGTFEVEEI